MLNPYVFLLCIHKDLFYSSGEIWSKHKSCCFLSLLGMGYVYVVCRMVRWKLRSTNLWQGAGRINFLDNQLGHTPPTVAEATLSITSDHPTFIVSYQ